MNFGESSNGRTADSGSAYRGSNPLSPAISQIVSEIEMFKFERLNAWQRSIGVFEKVAAVVDTIPHKYQSSIGDQIKRSCLSISANIAEATGREGIKEQKYHFSVAKGSIYETVSLLYAMKNRNYVEESFFHELYRELDEIAMMLHGLIKK